MTDISGLRRLFDNVFSNIMKYGDKREDIRVEAALNGTIVKIVVENHILEQAKKVESTRIGLKTCERICSDLQGIFRYTEEEHIFTVEITFPMAIETTKDNKEEAKEARSKN